jgi:carotenoid cleavage dioxygenase-like enzyme
MNSPPYAIGFSTLDKEMQLDDLPLRGNFPNWLNGTLVRTGPAKFEVGEQRYKHWFDGLAMLHKFSFRGGRLSYANRFIESKSYTEARNQGKISRGEFGSDPCRSLFGRVASLFFPRVTDNANVNVGMLAGKHIAMTETCMPIVFDRETLRTVGVIDYGNELKGLISTAHPHFDFNRKQAFNYCIRFARRSAYQVFSVGRDQERARLVGTVPVDKPAYMHSFGMSERYIVLVEFPFVVSPLELLLSGKPFIENYRWSPERGTRFWVINKDGGEIVARSEGEAFFAFHHVNTFEQGDEIVLDLVTYADPSIIAAFYLDRLRSRSGLSAGQLRRYRIPIGGNRVVSETLAEEKIELPRINYREKGTKLHRYVFGTGNRLKGNFLDQLVKIDVRDGTVLTWNEEGCYPGEPVFAGSPNGDAEDEGVVLSVVLDAKKGTSFLLVLDARSFEGRVRAEVPHHIPFGFHGQYFGE